MVRCTETYTVRRVVEGVGGVKAELIVAGQSRRQSVKGIETGRKKASRRRHQTKAW